MAEFSDTEFVGIGAGCDCHSCYHHGSRSISVSPETSPSPPPSSSSPSLPSHVPGSVTPASDLFHLADTLDLELDLEPLYPEHHELCSKCGTNAGPPTRPPLPVMNPRRARRRRVSRASRGLIPTVTLGFAPGTLIGAPGRSVVEAVDTPFRSENVSSNSSWTSAPSCILPIERFANQEHRHERVALAASTGLSSADALLGPRPVPLVARWPVFAPTPPPITPPPPPTTSVPSTPHPRLFPGPVDGLVLQSIEASSESDSESDSESEDDEDPGSSSFQLGHPDGNRIALAQPEERADSLPEVEEQGSGEPEATELEESVHVWADPGTLPMGRFYSTRQPHEMLALRMCDDRPHRRRSGSNSRRLAREESFHRSCLVVDKLELDPDLAHGTPLSPRADRGADAELDEEMCDRRRAVRFTRAQRAVGSQRIQRNKRIRLRDNK